MSKQLVKTNTDTGNPNINIKTAIKAVNAAKIIAPKKVLKVKKIVQIESESESSDDEIPDEKKIVKTVSESKASSDKKKIVKKIVKNVSESESSSNSKKEPITKKDSKTKKVHPKALTECTLCNYAFNNSSRKQLSCPYCQFIACTACIKRYLLMIQQEPHCAICHTAWSHEFYLDSFPKNFIYEEYKEHRENILLDREKSLIPMSMPEAERIKHIEHTKEKIQQSRNLLFKVMTLKNIFNHSNTISDEDELYARGLEQTINVAKANYDVEHNESYLQKILRKSVTTEKKEPVRQFIMKCPVDKCMGFLSSQYKCKLCETYSCSKCREVIGKKYDTPHTCNTEILASVKLIESDTKKCPNPECGVPVFRVSGCSQMWCCQCKTAFDWNTLKILDAKTIHNPHLIEYERLHGQHAVVNECGLPNQVAIQNKCKELNITAAISKDICLQLLSSIHHNNQIVIPRYHAIDIVEKNNELRIKFILNQLNEEGFKKLIFQKEKQENKKLDVRRILEAFTQICNDLVVRMYNSKTEKELLEIYEEVNKIVKYSSDNMKIVGKRYKNTVPYLDATTYRWT